MTKKLKTLPHDELIDAGYLHEVNRRFFHPLGLALAVYFPDDDEEDNETSLMVLDYRWSPEGMIFGDDTFDPEKTAKVQKEWDRRAQARMKELGYVIQPVPGVDE